MKCVAKRIAIIVALAAVVCLSGSAQAQLKIAGGKAVTPIQKVDLNVALGSSVMLARTPGRAFLKIGLTGFPLTTPAQRAQVNVAIVLDRSGSMSGEKMAKAKDAAVMAIDRLHPDDIVSVVAYNHSVEVLVPATKVSDRQQIYGQIHRLSADGNTALFAGVSKSAHEIRKFIDRNRINRVVLVSDGLANVGPSSTGELGALGYSLIKEGISVSTIGLGTGYNEDLMVALAKQSDGNHAFAENATDLRGIFAHEFGDLTSVVAREVLVEIQCAPGIRPIRSLGRTAEINGNRVVSRLNQLYSKQEKFLLLELEVPATAAGSQRQLATIDVRYANTVSKSTDILGATASVSFSDSHESVVRSQNSKVLVSSVSLIANENNKAAVVLRDQGRIAEAKDKLEQNAVFLETSARKYKSKKLKKRAGANRSDKDNLEGAKWKSRRKRMRGAQFAEDQQMVWD